MYLKSRIGLTRHAIKRAHQRLGIGRRAVARAAEKAWFVGERIDRGSKPDRWILGNLPADGSGSIAKKYGDFYYLFEIDRGPPVFVTVIRRDREI